jgi:hypothetical protein
VFSWEYPNTAVWGEESLSRKFQEFPLKRETPSFLLLINLNEVQIYHLRGRAALLPLKKPPLRIVKREPLLWINLNPPIAKNVLFLQ